MKGALLAMLVCLVAPPAFAQTLQQIAAEFERPLYCGHQIWSEEEMSSFIEAAVQFAPHLASNPRIAGTNGTIGGKGLLGYHSGVYFGPIPISDRRIDYYWIMFSGDLEKGWSFKQRRHYRALIADNHPTWLLIVDNNLEDDFEPTEKYALTIISRIRDMAEREVRSTDGDLLVPLSTDEIDQLHRFETSFLQPTDLVTEKNWTRPWWEGHIAITAKSQPPGSHQNVYQSAVKFAVTDLTDEGLKFIQASPAFNVFEHFGIHSRNPNWEKSFCARWRR